MNTLPPASRREPPRALPAIVLAFAFGLIHSPAFASAEGVPTPSVPAPAADAAIDALAQAWGPLAYLADSVWGFGEGFVIMDRIHWNNDQTRIRLVLNFYEWPAANARQIEFRPGPKPGTLLGDVNFVVKEKKDVLFRFDKAGVLTSDWFRLSGLNCRIDVRYVNGVYESRQVTAKGKTDFPPLSGMMRRLPEADLPAIHEGNKVAMVKAQEDAARRAEEAARQAELNRQREAEINALVARANAGATEIDRSEGRYEAPYQPDMLGTFQRTFTEAMGQSDVREAQAMDGIREAVRQGNAVYEAEQTRQRREQEYALERERVFAAEQQAQYEAQLAAQRQREADAREAQIARAEEARAREAQQIAQAEQARQSELQRLEEAQANTPPHSSVGQSAAVAVSSKKTNCWEVDAPPRVAKGYSKVSEEDARTIAKTNTRGCNLTSEMSCDTGRDPTFKGNGLALDENKNFILGPRWWDCQVAYHCGEKKQVCESGPPAGASRQ